MTDAASLYPSTAAAPTAQAPSTLITAPAPEQGAASRLYPEPSPRAPRNDVPEAVRELREADPTRRMFDPQLAFASVLPDGALGAEFDHAEAREVLQDLQATSDDAEQLVRLARTAERATDEEVAAWRTQAEQAITASGFTTADLDAARRLVARDGRLVAYLDATGLGDHPKVVVRFVELARSARARGQL